MTLQERLLWWLRASLPIFPFIAGADLKHFFALYAQGEGEVCGIIVLAVLVIWLSAMVLGVSWRYAIAGPVCLFGAGFVPATGNTLSLVCGFVLWLLFVIITIRGLVLIETPKTKSPRY